MSASFTLRGVSEMTRRMRDLQRRFPVAAGESAHAEAKSIYDISQDIVPVESGKLKDSGEVSNIQQVDGKEIVVAISYGSEIVPYAAAVHESESPGAKFLERPLRDSVRGMARRLADNMKVENV